MKFSVAIGTNQDTFFYLSLDFCPRPGVTPVRETKILLRSIRVMEFKCFDTAVVTAHLALAALEFDSHLSNFAPPLLDRFE